MGNRLCAFSRHKKFFCYWFKWFLNDFRYETFLRSIPLVGLLPVVKIKKFLQIRVSHVEKPLSTKNESFWWTCWKFKFLPLGQKFEFSKSSPKWLIFYTAVFRHGELESERIFWFWPQEATLQGVYSSKRFHSENRLKITEISIRKKFYASKMRAIDSPPRNP
jgi:hypothetical protein